MNAINNSFKMYNSFKKKKFLMWQAIGHHDGEITTITIGYYMVFCFLL